MKSLIKIIQRMMKERKARLELKKEQALRERCVDYSTRFREYCVPYYTIYGFIKEGKR